MLFYAVIVQKCQLNYLFSFDMISPIAASKGLRKSLISFLLICTIKSVALHILWLAVSLFWPRLFWSFYNNQRKDDLYCIGFLSIYIWVIGQNILLPRKVGIVTHYKSLSKDGRFMRNQRQKFREFHPTLKWLSKVLRYRR